MITTRQADRFGTKCGVAVFLALAILVVASLLPGCGRTDTPATKETTTTSGKSVETLLVNLDDVRRIADTESLNSGPGSQVQQPRHSDSNTPTPCRAVFDQEAIFDGDWTQFRSATYNGDVYSGTGQVKVRGIANVVQAVGIYRDADTARAHFDQLLPSLTACTALHAKNYDFTVRQLDTDTLSLSSSVWKLFYRVKSSVLIYVGALGVPQTEQSAQQILQTITNRVT